MTNNYKEHFLKEVEILEKGLKDGDKLAIHDFKDVICDITDIFSKQGHSGGSAPFYSVALSNTIKNVLSFKPLSPITCEDHEWTMVTEGDPQEEMYQNKRESAVFKNGKDSKPYYLDAICWSGEDEYDTFIGDVEEIRSRQFIKIPFTPKTFYIDVIKVYYNSEKHKDYHKDKDDKKYVYEIKDRNQLKEVTDYYDTDFESKDL